MSDNRRIRLGPQFRLDIEWWLNFCEQFNGKTAVISPNMVGGPTFYTDKHWVNVDLNEFPSKDRNINLLELIPVGIAVDRFSESYQNSQVLCYTDNTQVLSMVNKGVSINKSCMAVIRKMFWSLVIINSYLTAKHLSSKDNSCADLLSRVSVTGFTKLKHFALCCRPGEVR